MSDQSVSDVHATVLNLERDYASHKEKFEQWKLENVALCGHASYNKYVDEFIAWEKNVLDQLRDLRKDAEDVCFNRTVANDSSSSELLQQFPMVDLETQLNDALQKVKPAEFMVAVFAMAQKDPEFLKKTFQVIHRETKGTGFYNSILPQTSNSASQIRSIPSLYSTPPPVVTPLYAQGPSMNQGFRSVPEGWTIKPLIQKYSKSPFPTRMYKNMNIPYEDFGYGKDQEFFMKMCQVTYGKTSGTGFYNSILPQTTVSASQMQSVPSLYSNPPPVVVPSYVQGSSMHQVLRGIPEGWTIQPPIWKYSKPPSPTRDYNNMNVPYKDFSYGNSLL